jgi:vacuolar-type H+-ATPase subunit I/STV1
MKKIFCIFLAGLFVFNVFGKKTDIVSVQSQQLREMCRKIQELEQSISNAESEIEKINTKERNCVPFVRSIYEMLTRCFTTLFDIQRFSNILAINQTNNKNDFVRCLIIIKNFTSYFKFVSSQLCENNSEMTELKKNKTSFYDKLDKNKREYEELKKNLFCIVNNIGKDSEETIIQNVV